MNVKGPRAFDPVVVGNHECNARAAYYRHRWPQFLVAAVSMVQEGFGMGPRQTLQGAWLVLRANQAWAPVPDNDPDRARALMRRFYSLVATDGGLSIDPAEAARREVEWWRLHRANQRESALNEDDIVAALMSLYAYVYDVAPESVRDAGRYRVDAMRISDEWVAAGCDPGSDLLVDERSTLVASYTALRRAVRA